MSLPPRSPRRSLRASVIDSYKKTNVTHSDEHIISSTTHRSATKQKKLQSKFDSPSSQPHSQSTPSPSQHQRTITKDTEGIKTLVESHSGIKKQLHTYTPPNKPTSGTNHQTPKSIIQSSDDEGTQEDEHSSDQQTAPKSSIQAADQTWQVVEHNVTSKPQITTNQPVNEVSNLETEMKPDSDSNQSGQAKAEFLEIQTASDDSSSISNLGTMPIDDNFGKLTTKSHEQPIKTETKKQEKEGKDDESKLQPALMGHQRISNNNNNNNNNPSNEARSEASRIYIPQIDKDTTGTEDISSSALHSNASTQQRIHKEQARKHSNLADGQNVHHDNAQYEDSMEIDLDSPSKLKDKEAPHGSSGNNSTHNNNNNNNIKTTPNNDTAANNNNKSNSFRSFKNASSAPSPRKSVSSPPIVSSPSISRSYTRSMSAHGRSPYYHEMQLVNDLFAQLLEDDVSKHQLVTMMSSMFQFGPEVFRNPGDSNNNNDHNNQGSSSNLPSPQLPVSFLLQFFRFRTPLEQNNLEEFPKVYYGSQSFGDSSNPSHSLSQSIHWSLLHTPLFPSKAKSILLNYYQDDIDGSSTIIATSNPESKQIGVPFSAKQKIHFSTISPYPPSSSYYVFYQPTPLKQKTTHWRQKEKVRVMEVPVQTPKISSDGSSKSNELLPTPFSYARSEELTFDDYQMAHINMEPFTIDPLASLSLSPFTFTFPSSTWAGVDEFGISAKFGGSSLKYKLEAEEEALHSLKLVMHFLPPVVPHLLFSPPPYSFFNDYHDQYKMMEHKLSSNPVMECALSRLHSLDQKSMHAAYSTPSSPIPSPTIYHYYDQPEDDYQILLKKDKNPAQIFQFCVFVRTIPDLSCIPSILHLASRYQISNSSSSTNSSNTPQIPKHASSNPFSALYAMAEQLLLSSKGHHDDNNKVHDVPSLISNINNYHPSWESYYASSSNSIRFASYFAPHAKTQLQGSLKSILKKSVFTSDGRQVLPLRHGQTIHGQTFEDPQKNSHLPSSSNSSSKVSLQSSRRQKAVNQIQAINESEGIEINSAADSKIHSKNDKMDIDTTAHPNLPIPLNDKHFDIHYVQESEWQKMVMERYFISEFMKPIEGYPHPDKPHQPFIYLEEEVDDDDVNLKNDYVDSSTKGRSGKHPSKGRATGTNKLNKNQSIETSQSDSEPLSTSKILWKTCNLESKHFMPDHHAGRVRKKVRFDEASIMETRKALVDISFDSALQMVFSPIPKKENLDLPSITMELTESFEQRGQTGNSLVEESAQIDTPIPFRSIPPVLQRNPDERTEIDGIGGFMTVNENNALPPTNSNTPAKPSKMIFWKGDMWNPESLNRSMLIRKKKLESMCPERKKQRKEHTNQQIPQIQSDFTSLITHSPFNHSSPSSFPLSTNQETIVTSTPISSTKRGRSNPRTNRSSSSTSSSSSPSFPSNSAAESHGSSRSSKYGSREKRQKTAEVAATAQSLPNQIVCPDSPLSAPVSNVLTSNSNIDIVASEDDELPQNSKKRKRNSQTIPDILSESVDETPPQKKLKTVITDTTVNAPSGLVEVKQSSGRISRKAKSAKDPTTPRPTSSNPVLLPDTINANSTSHLSALTTTLEASSGTTSILRPPTASMEVDIPNPVSDTNTKLNTSETAPAAVRPQTDGTSSSSHIQMPPRITAASLEASLSAMSSDQLTEFVERVGHYNLRLRNAIQQIAELHSGFGSIYANLSPIVNSMISAYRDTREQHLHYHRQDIGQHHSLWQPKQPDLNFFNFFNFPNGPILNTQFLSTLPNDYKVYLSQMAFQNQQPTKQAALLFNPSQQCQRTQMGTPTQNPTRHQSQNHSETHISTFKPISTTPSLRPSPSTNPLTSPFLSHAPSPSMALGHSHTNNSRHQKHLKSPDVLITPGKIENDPLHASTFSTGESPSSIHKQRFASNSITTIIPNMNTSVHLNNMNTSLTEGNFDPDDSVTSIPSSIPSFQAATQPFNDDDGHLAMFSQVASVASNNTTTMMPGEAEGRAATLQPWDAHASQNTADLSFSSSSNPRISPLHITGLFNYCLLLTRAIGHTLADTGLILKEYLPSPLISQSSAPETFPPPLAPSFFENLHYHSLEEFMDTIQVHLAYAEALPKMALAQYQSVLSRLEDVPKFL